MRWLVLAVMVALLMSACANEALIDEVDRDPNGRIIEGGRLGTTRLIAGDCFNERDGAVVRSVDAVACTQPHRAQVLGRVVAESGDTWPGVEALTTEAAALCGSLADEVLSTDLLDIAGLARFDLAAYVPDEPAWNDGDRMIVCWVESSEPVTIDLRRTVSA